MLPLHKRKKIFRARWREKLELEPIEVEIDDLTIGFRHLNGCRGDIPGTRRILNVAMSQMKGNNEWQILPKVMKAVKQSRKIKDDTWLTVIHKASREGQLAPLFELAKKPREGLRLDTPEKAQAFLTAVVRQAATDKWSHYATQKAFHHAKDVLTTLAADDHKPRAGPWQRMSHDPQFLAVPMTLTAVLAVQHGQRQEYREAMVRFTEGVVSRWPEGKGLLTLHPDEAYARDGALSFLMGESQFLTVAAPVLKGLRLVEEGLRRRPGDEALAAKVASRRAVVEEEVASAVRRLREAEGEGKLKFARTRGGEMYNTCFVPPPTEK